ncbi:23S rRNA (adenine(1618)-N(6))-methyltransferase RlmF [Lacinutrix sp. C3R15]|uniref:23S rRNA (adenine(1618)-N(6))-methyltransferase RlmF n=1 Tax=Flavobacteriaceae TaxID=49546 RepID=UPI001C08397A|nr:MULTISPECIES: 23S rRNA (adenine(1618)-N(6))-methyltransferase RlmF [Flavobacteriaceae]MBU2940575.1 23S rRNA (adenine(1618)-N(6))-methyltransferase RlmF [Lacinutrix sp. C3R15]MDO6623893.1 23S rRNA (adenine(1618)-N(6))-methyltransferase RlmF [Oceanihabitans sp. 1_MG-2023]
MHKKNKHVKGYDFEILLKELPELAPFVFTNAYQTQTIDFANPQAVKMLNKALLKTYYAIDYWEFDDAHLCPPIPGRVDYIHHIAELLKPDTFKNKIQVLDIGTGATCIYPLLGVSQYHWHFVATDVEEKALQNAQKIINNNALHDAISLRLQKDKSKILDGIIQHSDTFAVSICNPPFYKNQQDALAATQRKLKGLGKETGEAVRNFSGTASELWFPGGEKAFLHSYLYESSLYKKNCFWFTSLVSNKDLVKSMQKSLKKLGATQIKVINMQQGNKISRVVAWTFLTDIEQKDWKA